MTVITQTSFITNDHTETNSILLLKNEAIDRFDSIVRDLPKYKNKLVELIENFTVIEMLYLINIIYRDNEFKFL